MLVFSLVSARCWFKLMVISEAALVIFNVNIVTYGSFALECPSEKLPVFCKGKEFPVPHACTVPKSARNEEAEAEILDSSCVGSLAVYSIQYKSILLSPHYRSGCVTCSEMRGRCSSITALSPTEPPVVKMIQKWKKLSRCPVNSGCLRRCVCVSINLTLYQRCVYNTPNSRMFQCKDWHTFHMFS